MATTSTVYARTGRRSRNPQRSASTWTRESQLTRNEQRPAEDRRDCYWLYVVTCCKRDEGPKLVTIKDPAQLEWDEIRKIDHYALSVKDLAQ